MVVGVVVATLLTAVIPFPSTSLLEVYGIVLFDLWLVVMLWAWRRGRFEGSSPRSTAA